MRVDFVIYEKLFELLSELIVQKFSCRNIDRNLNHFEAQITPPFMLINDFIEHILSHIHNQSGHLRKMNKFFRAYQSESWMIPANQRLRTCHLHGLKIDNRLVINFKLLLLQALSHLFCH